METTSPGQIYLADQRGIIEEDGLTRWCTFNYEKYADPNRGAFGPLLTLNDELFTPGHQQKYQTLQNSWVVVVPITGEVDLKDIAGNSQKINIGQAKVLYVTTGDSIILTNPYTDSRINFLYLEIKADTVSLNVPLSRLYDFALNGKPNQLVNIISNNDSNAPLPFTMYIGMFEGRGENLFKLQNNYPLFFAYVIAGAFETQGRLMHQRDGLALWDLQEADIEALSNNAVMLVFGLKR